MRKKYRLCYLCALLMSVGMVIPARAQGHWAKASTEATFYFGIETPLPEPSHPVTVDVYHTDLELSFRSTGWDVVVSYDRPGSGPGGLDIPQEDALLYGNSNSRYLLASIPSGYEFIGARDGEPFWILPQNAGTGALALGVATELADVGRLRPWNPGDPRGAYNRDLWFELQLLDVNGPADANFALWQADGVHPPVVFMSTQNGGITPDDVFYISTGGHVHMNWGFTKAGLYALHFRVFTVLQCDPQLTADCAPPGDGTTFYGDGFVDFQDLEWLADHWGETASPEDPNTFMFTDPNDPDHAVGIDELRALVDQWHLYGYPVPDPNDPNEPGLNALMTIQDFTRKE